jgi:uncharacterized repeat protein (TIGR03803 family)
MRSKKTCSGAKSIFAIFVTFLLMSAVVPSQAQAQKFKVLHTFHGWNGAEPVGGLVRDAAGNIYGTTGVGGSGNCSGGTGCGTAFKLNNSGQQIWLHKFNGWDGAIPGGSLLRGASGILLGATGEGGDLSCDPPYGCGVVFKLDETGQKETVLHKFTGPPDGDSPYPPLSRDQSGNLYGVTVAGGADLLGTVFKIDTAGRETTLYSFAGPPGGGGDGAWPGPGVIRDAAGNLYGTTFAGGVYGAGAVYEFSSGGEETLLYSFSGGSDGAQPSSTLLLDSQGNLYGTTQNGGNVQCGGTGCGVVFELSPQSGGGWTEIVLYAFCSLTGCVDGLRPRDGPLIMDAAGNLYGTTIFGGAHRNCNGDGCGVVFKLGSAGKETVLHSFTGGTDGAIPVAGVILDSRNNLYGTTQEGGDLNCHPKYGGCGVVFKIAP